MQHMHSVTTRRVPRTIRNSEETTIQRLEGELGKNLDAAPGLAVSNTVITALKSDFLATISGCHEATAQHKYAIKGRRGKSTPESQRPDLEQVNYVAQHNHMHPPLSLRVN